MIKNSPANSEKVGSVPGSGRSSEEGNSNPLAWETSWTEEPGRRQSMGVTKELDMT